MIELEAMLMTMASPNTHTTLSTSEEAASNATLLTNVPTTWSTNHTERYAKNGKTGGYDYELLEGTDSRYECPICLLCLRDPVLTTCGHRFCSSCISQWVIKENGKCPVDSVSLSHENIFPDNYTRREIMQSLAKCPYSSKEKLGCTAVLPISELEKHIQTEHVTATSSSLLMLAAGSSSSKGGGGLLECPYKEVGCAIPLRQDQLHRHLEMDVHHHLQLLTAAYKRLKIYSSRSNLEYPPGASSDYFLRQDSRDSGRWLLADDSLSPDDYQFRRQRSWDSVRFARKHNSQIRRTNLNSTWLPESDESLCQKEHSSQHPASAPAAGASSKSNGTCSDSSTPCGGGSHAGGVDPHLQDIFERLVLLEQKDREKQIKLDKLEAVIASVVSLNTTSAQINKDFTARYCHGVYVWKIPDFRKLCMDMRRNPNRVLTSSGFYTDTFGYKLCLRFNLTTPSSSSLGDMVGGGGAHGGSGRFGGGGGGMPIDVPLEHDEDTFISLYVHFMQGEFNDTLHWPFEGEMKLMVIHPTTPEDSITEILFSKPETAAFAKPTLPRNVSGFGYAEFCPVNKIFANGFVKDDTLVFKILAKSSN